MVTIGIFLPCQSDVASLKALDLAQQRGSIICANAIYFSTNTRILAIPQKNTQEIPMSPHDVPVMRNATLCDWAK